MNKNEIVTSSKSLDGVCLQNLSLEDEDLPTLKKDFKNEIIEDTTKLATESSNEKEQILKVSKLEDADRRKPSLIQSPDCLSNQIKKLSNAVQSEADLIQRRIVSLEDSMSTAKSLGAQQELLKITIPRETNNPESAETIPHDQKSSNFASPGITSVG